MTRERMIDLSVLAWAKLRDLEVDLLPIAFASFTGSVHLVGIRSYFKRLSALPADRVHG